MNPTFILLLTPPLLTTALLLLATGSTWRARRLWFESIGLGTGLILLALALGWLPRLVAAGILPSASICVAWLVLALSEWRFAPDRGQTGFAWALQATLRPTLGTGFGAAAGFAPLLICADSSHLPVIQPPVLFIGLIAARRFDLAVQRRAGSAPF